MQIANGCALPAPSVARALGVFCLAAALHGAELKVRLSLGHQAARPAPYYVRLVPDTPGVEVRDVTGQGLEPGEGRKGDVWQGRAGAGDVDSLEFTISYPEEPATRLQKTHIIWADLIAHSDADTARRLGSDPAFRTNPQKVTILLNEEGTRGFTVSLDQLREHRALWIPSLDAYVTSGDQPVSFEDHQRALAEWKGGRILDRVEREPEATYEGYASLWEDMGNPAYTNPQQRGPGHIVCLTWDSAIPKFGIDRGAGVWNDYGNPDHFQFWFGFGDLAQGITGSWKSQGLHDGLPVITTLFERDGVRYEVEQFAYPLHGPPGERRGDIPMLLLAKVKATELRGVARTLPVTMSHRRQFPPFQDTSIVADHRAGVTLFRGAAHRRVLFAIQGAGGQPEWSGTQDYQREMKRVNATVFLPLPPGGSREFVVKLPSPPVNAEEAATLEAIDYQTARQATLRFWMDYVRRGARFQVPEKAVNELFRATLWHALRLPRRHGGPQPDVTIDLPYSNFAYSQTGTPWPVNQSVYVDYMLYELRGYHDISVEELLAQFRNNQEVDGRLNGVANWLVYTPGMLYAVAQDYLLSGDRGALDRLLPQTLKAMDWCLREVRAAAGRPGAERGLVSGPLNDGTGEGTWAFNQAYLYAGLERFGRVLELIGNPRAREAREAAEAVRRAVARGFGSASARSTVVQLRDHTWSPYVPGEALTFRRNVDKWYPADVDTGAVHLLRLKALPAAGELADALLNDHEDNLFLHGWGLANEPVYNQQGTAYLLRDDPKAAIRTFYSYMAGAFSHSVFEPVEHRWTHGQYFGPPSTDGAWMELYRNMLLREVDDETLLIGQATPRRWLAEGQAILVGRAPTWFGPVTFHIASQAASDRISADVEMPARGWPRTLLVRLRHPDGRSMRAVTVNGKAWSDFDPAKEWVRIQSPGGQRYTIVASY